MELKNYMDYFDEQVEASRSGAEYEVIHRLICLGHYAAKEQGAPYCPHLAMEGMQYVRPN